MLAAGLRFVVEALPAGEPTRAAQLSLANQPTGFDPPFAFEHFPIRSKFRALEIVTERQRPVRGIIGARPNTHGTESSDPVGIQGNAVLTAPAERRERVGLGAELSARGAQHGAIGPQSGMPFGWRLVIKTLVPTVHNNGVVRRCS